MTEYEKEVLRLLTEIAENTKQPEQPPNPHGPGSRMHREQFTDKNDNSPSISNRVR